MRNIISNISKLNALFGQSLQIAGRVVSVRTGSVSMVPVRVVGSCWRDDMACQAEKHALRFAAPKPTTAESSPSTLGGHYLAALIGSGLLLAANLGGAVSHG